MNCKNDACRSHRIMNVSGKTSDCFNGRYGEYELDDYVPMDIGIGGGDYIEFSYCLDCGQIQGDFPINPDLDEWEKLED